MKKETLLLPSLFAATTALLSTQTALADNIEMIVPFSAGGGTDLVARVFEPGFSNALGSTTIIRNIDGASGTIGTAEAAKESSTTIGYLPIGPVAIQPSLRQTPYGLDSWTYICQTVNNPVFLFKSSDNDEDILERIINSPEEGRIMYGSSGPGTVPHLAMAALANATGVSSVHLPFPGTGPAMNAMAGGEIELFADTASVIEANHVTPLAIFAQERSTQYPDIPTMKELGYDLEFSVWQGVFAPKEISEERKEALSSACLEALESDSMISFSESANINISYKSSSEFEKFVRDNFQLNADIIQEIGLNQ
ncbi:Bug family tripartite tricarboxylate transporter substrate binding protein [Vreelandella sp. GE22]